MASQFGRGSLTADAAGPGLRRRRAGAFTAWVEDGGLTQWAGPLLVVLVGFRNASPARIRDVHFYVTTPLGPGDAHVGGVDPFDSGKKDVPIPGTEDMDPVPNELARLTYTFSDADGLAWVKEPGKPLRKGSYAP